jgi:NAD(P)-dependent dehydrogenase (short-subunit alcohol dehydrogenase family)
MTTSGTPRRIVVTGASRGIGLELVRQAVERGDRVFALARDPEGSAGLQELMAKHPEALHAVACDVADDRSVEASRDAVAKAWEGVDLLVNNAGVKGTYPTPLVELDWRELHEVFEINAVAPLRVTRAFLPLLRRGAGPKVLQLSTLMGSIADNSSGGAYAYRMSKAALNMATRNLGHELGREGITCLAIHPGWVQTDMGGSRAPLPVRDAVAAMLAAIDGVGVERNGAFVDREGKPLPW